jgi:hypothetical protein
MCRNTFIYVYDHKSNIVLPTNPNYLSLMWMHLDTFKCLDTPTLETGNSGQMEYKWTICMCISTDLIQTMITSLSATPQLVHQLCQDTTPGYSRNTTIRTQYTTERRLTSIGDIIKFTNWTQQNHQFTKKMNMKWIVLEIMNMYWS